MANNGKILRDLNSALVPLMGKPTKEDYKRAEAIVNIHSAPRHPDEQVVKAKILQKIKGKGEI